MPKASLFTRLATVAVALIISGHAQTWDFPSSFAEIISSATECKLKLNVEQRVRYESRTGTNFGKDPDIESGLVRTRVAMTYRPVKWLKISGMVQDARAPWYGANAPSSIRDYADLQEGYIELFPDMKEGFGLEAGRKMVTYGEGRIIGAPQWGNVARTFDEARVYQRFKRARFEFLYVSPVKIQIAQFNSPVFGDHVWGTYNSFPNIYRTNLLEAYVLRHEQNRPGGFTGGSKAAGTDRLGTTTFGFRVTGPLVSKINYSVEGALQNGKVGPAEHRAAVWYSAVSRRWALGRREFEVSGEYKYASGTDNPKDTTHDGTWDQLYAANHDKFGHEDLFGWRNLHNIRSLETLSLTKNFAVNFMYDTYWLSSAFDSLYNSSSQSIARSANGSAGRHVGQETDLFVTYKIQHFTLGAGYGHFFAGEFVQKTTPGVGPTYLYIFHTYTL